MTNNSNLLHSLKRASMKSAIDKSKIDEPTFFNHKTSVLIIKNQLITNEIKHIEYSKI